MASRDAIFAIDYGTSNSLVALATAQGVLPPLAIDPGAADTSVLKSVIFTPEPSQWFLGSEAINEYQDHAGRGRMFKSLKRYLPDPAFAGTKVHDKQMSLIDLIAVFLGTLRERAQIASQRDATRVVMGRPALFSEDPLKDQLAEQRLEAAARQAGFKEIHFLPEPIAAACDLLPQLSSPKIVLVADFGGGTSDFTVVRLDPKGFRREDVLAVGGLSIAGDAFDGSLMQHKLAPHFGSTVTYRLPMSNNVLHLPKQLIQRLNSPADINFLGRSDIFRLLQDIARWSLAEEDSLRMQQLFTLIEEQLGYQLYREIEKVKIALSEYEKVDFKFSQSGIEIQEAVGRAEFQAQSAELVAKICRCLDEVVQRSGLKPQEIDMVFATGGTAHLPALRAELVGRFGAQRFSEGRFFHSIVSGLAQFAYRNLL